MKTLGSLGGFPVGLSESCRTFCETLLLQSHSLRHQERHYLENVVPTLRSYEQQVVAARTLVYQSRKRMRLAYLLASAALETCVYADAPSSEMCDVASEELDYLKAVLGPGCHEVEPDELNLKDLGWTTDWRDPSPDCPAFRNSIAEVRYLDETLSVQGLLEYGLVPSDLGESYQEDMRACGLLTPHSDEALSAHGGDWRRVVRDLGPDGVCLC